MTNQFLYENGTQAPDRRKKREFHPRGSPFFILTGLSSLHSFVFELRIVLSLHLLHGTEAYPLLLTNAWRVFSIPKCIIYLAKYLNRILHGRVIIAVAFRPAAATRILISSRLLLIFIHLSLMLKPLTQEMLSMVFPLFYVDSNFPQRQRERDITPRDQWGKGRGCWRRRGRRREAGNVESESDRRKSGRMGGGSWGLQAWEWCKVESKPPSSPRFHCERYSGEKIDSMCPLCWGMPKTMTSSLSSEVTRTRGKSPRTALNFYHHLPFYLCSLFEHRKSSKNKIISLVHTIQFSLFLIS